MKRILLAAMFCVGFGSASWLSAQEQSGNPMAAAADRSESWDYRQAQQATGYEPNTRAIIYEKAAMRAANRSARLTAMSWYGMDNARPTAAPTPFTSLYSPVWQMPGGQPFAWNVGSRPTYIFYYR